MQCILFVFIYCISWNCLCVCCVHILVYSSIIKQGDSDFSEILSNTCGYIPLYALCNPNALAAKEGGCWEG